MKRVVVAVVIVIVTLAIAVLIVARTFYPDNVAETSADGGRKGLKTRIYRSDLKTAAAEIEKLIPGISTYGANWKLVDKSVALNVATMKVEVPVVIFTDDLEVTVKRADNEHEVTVDVRSESRVGQSDFGENARHVRKLLSALDEKLQ